MNLAQGGSWGRGKGPWLLLQSLRAYQQAADKGRASIKSFQWMAIEWIRRPMPFFFLPPPPVPYPLWDVLRISLLYTKYIHIFLVHHQTRQYFCGLICAQRRLGKVNRNAMLKNVWQRGWREEGGEGIGKGCCGTVDCSYTVHWFGLIVSTVASDRT